MNVYYMSILLTSATPALKGWLRFLRNKCIPEVSRKSEPKKYVLRDLKFQVTSILMSQRQ